MHAYKCAIFFLRYTMYIRISQLNCRKIIWKG